MSIGAVNFGQSPSQNVHNHKLTKKQKTYIAAGAGAVTVATGLVFRKRIANVGLVKTAMTKLNELGTKIKTKSAEIFSKEKFASVKFSVAEKFKELSAKAKTKYSTFTTTAKEKFGAFTTKTKALLTKAKNKLVDLFSKKFTKEEKEIIDASKKGAKKGEKVVEILGKNGTTEQLSQIIEFAQNPENKTSLRKLINKASKEAKGPKALIRNLIEMTTPKA